MPAEPPNGVDVELLHLEGQELAIFSWADSVDVPNLTGAERAVLRGLLAGRSNREIAKGRRRSTRTVANQIASLFRKLGVASRNELIARFAGTKS